MEPPKYIVNVEAAIYQNNKWLMILRSKKEDHAGGTLSMVGGKIDYTDSLTDTLEFGVKREILEEVNVQVSDKLEYVESKMFVSAKGNYVIDIVFIAEYTSGTPEAMLEDEVDDVSWLTLDEIKSNPNTPPWILASMEKAEAVRLKTTAK
jgi:ADP-ribose pyrophosphatase YjhB (NUDIX family)